MSRTMKRPTDSSIGTRFLGAFACTSLSLVLAACNAGPLLQTGSLSPAAADAPPKQVTSVDRALHVAATSARAQKCGYYFDPNGLRANFLTAETQRGTGPGDLAKVTQAYDYTHRTISGKIANSAEYCGSEARTDSIKSSLNKVLAGDFEPPPPKKADPGGGLFAMFESDASDNEVFNRDHIYDPLLNESPTKKVDE
jgi:hypothetical protein